jgi:hypothetical protein
MISTLEQNDSIFNRQINWLLLLIEKGSDSKPFNIDNYLFPGYLSFVIELFGMVEGRPWTPARDASNTAKNLSRNIASYALNRYGLRELR